MLSHVLSFSYLSKSVVDSTDFYGCLFISACFCTLYIVRPPVRPSGADLLKILIEILVRVGYKTGDEALYDTQFKYTNEDWKLKYSRST